MMQSQGKSDFCRTALKQEEGVVEGEIRSA
jgi:hypothetical protein